MGNMECETCKVLAEVADAFIQEESPVQETKAMLMRVCKKVIPEVERPQCISMVEKYTSRLLKLISQHMDPLKTCQVVKLCPNVSTYNILRRH